MHLNIIVAHDLNRGIGNDGTLVWSLPNDLKHVKEITLHETIVMGKKTFESIGKPLAKRKNVVLTSDKDFKHDGVDVVHSIDNIYKLHGEVFIFGGQTLYREFIDKVDTMYVTLINEEFKCDTYFPLYDFDDWNITVTDGIVDDKNAFEHKFLYMTKKEK